MYIVVRVYTWTADTQTHTHRHTHTQTHSSPHASFPQSSMCRVVLVGVGDWVVVSVVCVWAWVSGCVCVSVLCVWAL